MRVNGSTGCTIWPLSPALLELVEQFQRIYYAPDPGPLLVTLATYAAHRVKELDPVWLMLVGGPSTGKSEIINLLRECPAVYNVSTITKAGLLSATKDKDKAKNASGGLLNQIGESGFICFKDFSSIIGMQRDEQSEVLDAFREIYDGRWNRHVGTDGGRTLSWSGRVGIAAASTSVIDQHRKMMSIMGDRFLYFRMPVLNADQNEQMALRSLDNMTQIALYRAGMGVLIRDFLSSIQREAPAPPSEDYRDCVAGLANLVARCRSEVTWDWRRTEIEQAHAPEGSGRLTAQLGGLDAGLALIGVPEIRRYNLVRRTALYSIQPIRLDILNQLAPRPKLATEPPGKTVGEMQRKLYYGQVTLYRALQELEAHGLIVRHARYGARWTLTEEWLERWNRSPEGSVVSVEAGGVTEIPIIRGVEPTDR